MINLHFNGDIIRCPDIAKIKAELTRSRKKLHVCNFGIEQYYCEAWKDYCKFYYPEDIHKKLCCQCDLSKKYETIETDGKIVKQYLCPKAQERYDNANKQKHFRIDNTNYRKIASAGHYLMKTSKTKALFLLLSFPPWKNKFNPYKNEKILNECFSKFVENLTKNYSCGGYIAVRELGEHTRRYHYHLLCSIPFTSFVDLNAAWCSAISDICEYSKNALSSDKENRLIHKNNPAEAVRYICKYISKSKNQSSKTRLIFISNNLWRKAVSIDQSTYQLYNKTGIMNIETYLFEQKCISVTKLNDYCTAFRINGNTEFNKICKELIYPMFGLSSKNDINLYSFPVINSS